MLLYIKNLVQLILSPSKGWEDVSASLESTDNLLRRSFYPLAALAAASEFVRLFYPGNGGFLTQLELAIALFGAFFVAYFIARIILVRYLAPYINGDVNIVKISNFVIYGLGLLLFIEVVENILPTDLTLVKFLPLFVALVLYRANAYLSVTQGYELRFLCIAAGAVIVVPVLLFSLLELIIV